MVTEEADRSPMERTSPPFVPERAVPVLSIVQLRALLDSCKDRELLQLRDTAIIRLLLDSGGRFGEVAGLTVDDLDFDMDVAHAMGKSRRPRALPFGDKTVAALARYLRARARDKQAGRPELWLAEKGKGPLYANGVKQMLRRRGEALDPPEARRHPRRAAAWHPVPRPAHPTGGRHTGRSGALRADGGVAVVSAGPAPTTQPRAAPPRGPGTRARRPPPDTDAGVERAA